MTNPRPTEISRCFQGVLPSIVATCDAHGVPNVVYVSQVHLIDDRHVALSRQFFNKTSRNIDVNPRVCVEVVDPLTSQAYRLRLRFLRSEATGPLFDAMALRIQAIASHTGMAGVFRLIAADIFEVQRVECLEGYLTGAVAPTEADVSLDGLRTEMRGVQWISARINQAADLESLLDGVLEALDTYFNFHHSMVLLYEEPYGRVVTVASRGYGESGVGAEVAVGEGLIGTVARERRVLRMTGLDASFRYSRAVRRQVQGSGTAVSPEIPLPGLPDAQSALVIPLLLGDRLVGVLAAESREPMRFDEWDETYLAVLGNQIALGIDRMSTDDEAEEPRLTTPALPPPPLVPEKRLTFLYYREDESIFVDDEYLIRNVPARILWKLLGEYRDRARTEFTNRELRLDPALGLPEFKDNLESRLILLRRRLEQKCPDVRIVPTGRGRFALAIDGGVELVER